MSTQYKVQGNVLPTQLTEGNTFTDEAGWTITQTRTISQWLDADSPLDAAARFILDNPEVNSSPVLVVDTDYNIANYPLDNVKITIDYMVGLRE